MNFNTTPDRLYAIAFLLFLVLGVVGACVVGTAAFVFLPRPAAPQRLTPTPIFLTPTEVIILPGETSTPLTPTFPGSSSTPPPAPGNVFSILRVSALPPCDQRSLIRSRVFDAHGEGLGNVRVHLFNDWGYSVFFSTLGCKYGYTRLLRILHGPRLRRTPPGNHGLERGLDQPRGRCPL